MKHSPKNIINGIASILLATQISGCIIISNTGSLEQKASRMESKAMDLLEQAMTLRKEASDKKIEKASDSNQKQAEILRSQADKISSIAQKQASTITSRADDIASEYREQARELTQDSKADGETAKQIVGSFFDLVKNAANLADKNRTSDSESQEKSKEDSDWKSLLDGFEDMTNTLIDAASSL